ncbi:MAG: M20 family metallo-hydrolase [Synergistaceae bacterium]|nr:M20 family metallo-hydrolase [Synergistaceae bacterium]
MKDKIDEKILGEKIFGEVERLRDDMVAALSRICRIPAVSPHNGGTGEEEKAREIEKLVAELGFGKVEWQRVDDGKSPTGSRSSLFLEYEGASPRRLCILTHTDIVPEGDLSLWTHDPYAPVVEGGRLYGRGVSDNGMSLIASLYALKALSNLKVVPAFTVCLGFLADEEMGSAYGIRPLVERGLFRQDDLVIAPDGGNEKGDFIEISEKSGLKLEFAVTGRQAHASMPHTGLNACRVANLLSVELDDALHKAFLEEDALFSPPSSTFEPTRRFANVPNLNTVPGKERFGFDCRVLPSVPLDDVIAVAERVKNEVARRTGAVIDLEIGRSDAAPPTPAESDIVRLLSGSVKEVLGVEPTLGGIGGGTFAAFFRRKGIPAVVWQQECDTAHQPDEYEEIPHIVNNAKVFASMMTDGFKTI